MKGEIGIGKEVELDAENLAALEGFKLRPGKIVTLTGTGRSSFRARIISIKGPLARAFVFEEMPAPESALELILLQALPSKERIELIIEKGTELGVDVIVPFHSERSTTLGERDAVQAKSHRWQRRAVRAAEQCRRAKVPLVAPCGDLEDALLWAQDAVLKLMLWEKERALGLKDELRDRRGAASVALLVGPEGGLSGTEVGMLEKKGFRAVSLGGRILRTETAAIAALSLIQYELGDLGSIK